MIIRSVNVKRLLSIFLLSFLISPAYADEVCVLTSEVEPDVTITINYPGSGYGFGTMNYKQTPSFIFEVGISNGYGTQYYVFRTYSSDALDMKTKQTHSERFNNTKIISQGRFINFVGDQLARITPEKNRKSGKLRALMPTLSQDYYYYLPNNTKKGEYGRFNLSTKMKSILNAFEGFFVDSGGCESYFAYGWK